MSYSESYFGFCILAANIGLPIRLAACNYFRIVKNVWVVFKQSFFLSRLLENRNSSIQWNSRPKGDAISHNTERLQVSINHENHTEQLSDKE